MVRAAALVGTAAVALATMSLSCVWPAEYERDGGVNPPPYVVWDTAFPPFLPVLAFNDADYQTVLTVKVGDADVDQQLLVRFCARKTTQGADYIVNTEKLVEPTSSRTPDRKPVSTDAFNPCTIGFDSPVPAEQTRYLYVVVTDGSFRTPNNGCDVTPGAGSATGVWPFTCDKPK
jgi:hypothetical protein